MIRLVCNSSLLLAMAAFASVPAAAAPADPFVTTGGQADAPAGFIALCARDQALCLAGMSSTILGTATHGVAPAEQIGAPLKTHPETPTVVGMPADYNTALGTAATVFKTYKGGRVDNRLPPVSDPLALLNKINHDVNRQIVQVSDLISTGTEEEWDRPGRVGRPAGDCEDIAIEKRMRLVEAGFPADHLFYGVVYRKNFGLHVVLVVRLADGDVVLDSARPEILPWGKVRYVWLRVQSPSDPMRWSRFGTATPAVAAAPAVATVTPAPVTLVAAPAPTAITPGAIAPAQASAAIIAASVFAAITAISVNG